MELNDIKKRIADIDSKIVAIQQNIKKDNDDIKELTKQRQIFQEQLYEMDSKYVRVVCERCQGVGIEYNANIKRRVPCSNPRCHGGYEWREIFEE